MKLVKGTLGSAGFCGGDKPSTVLTATVPGKVQVTMGQEITMLGFEGFDEKRLKDLHDYLTDRPALMDDEAVKQGVWALRTVLDIPTPLHEI